MGLRALPRSGVWGVRQTAVRLRRLAAVLAVATCALAVSTVLIPAAWAVNANPMTPGPRRPGVLGTPRTAWPAGRSP